MSFPDGSRDLASGTKSMSPATDRRNSIGMLWKDLQGPRRLAAIGLAVVALVLVGLATAASWGVRDAIIAARGQALRTSVEAIEGSLPALGAGRNLSQGQVAELETLLTQLLGRGHLNASIWSLDGRNLYADSGRVIGQSQSSDARRLAEAIEIGVVSVRVESVTGSGQPAAPVVAHFVAIHDPETGRPVAVLESHDDIAFLDEALQRTEGTTRGMLVVGLVLLGGAVGVLLATAMRSTNRERRLAQARAHEFAVLSTTADAVATSLDPTRLFAALQRRVVEGLALDRLSVEDVAETSPAALSVPLRDGTRLVADRAAPLTDEEQQIIRAAAHSLDAALANTALFAEVHRAASERQVLIQRVAIAHEDERRRLVGELHDSLASDLIRTLYAVRRAEMLTLPSSDLSESIRSIERMVADAEVRLRAFLSSIRPVDLDISSLTAAASDVVTRFRVETGITVRLHARGEPDRLRASAQVVIVRALEEALLNVTKHAGAGRVRVTLAGCADELRLGVSDDGVGWPETFVTGGGRGLGLDYLRERVAGQGGTVHIAGSRMGGARLEVRVPMERVAA